MARHHGRCHCGAIQFDVEVDLKETLSCNCSLCGKTGAIMVFVEADKLSKVVGIDRSTDYQFAKKRIHHRFCPTCGVRPLAFGPGPGRAIVNVRCLDDVDVHALPAPRPYNGKAL